MVSSSPELGRSAGTVAGGGRDESRWTSPQPHGCRGPLSLNGDVFPLQLNSSREAYFCSVAKYARSSVGDADQIILHAHNVRRSSWSAGRRRAPAAAFNWME